MDLIDRYLAAVHRHLPRHQQDDIIRELSDSLRTEAEERAQEAGHALSDEEQAALLKKHGHPWLMASRFAAQQQLIGPALFPYYKQTLVLVLFWVVLPLTLITIVLSGIAHGIGVELFERVARSIWNGTIYSVGIVTALFYGLEQQRVRITTLDNWDPGALPDFRDGRHIPRSEAVAGLVFALIFLMWWTDLAVAPSLSSFISTPMAFIPGPIWKTMYFPVLTLVATQMVVSVVDIFRPWRTLTVSLIDIAVNLANAAVLIYVVSLRPQFFIVLGDPTQADAVTKMARIVNGGLTWSLIVVTAVILLDVLYEIWQVSHSRGTAFKSALV